MLIATPWPRPLGEHFAQGRLTLDELDARLDAAFTATTQRELSLATCDLPDAMVLSPLPITAPRPGAGSTQTDPAERRRHVSWDYGPLAGEIYELDKPMGHSFGDVEYYTRSLSGVSGRILEPATGTGRILIPLLEAGHEVDGLDVSPDMLAICRQQCHDRGLNPVLLDADMTSFTRPATYKR